MSAPEIFRVLQVGLGIGLVIFVHELGHFMAARLCGVRVDVFSLGFGPKILGKRVGDTLYQIAAVPFGGYVRMAGEMPDGSGREPRPDELGAKSVPARFLIYSGGVLMNVVFALVCLPIAMSVGIPAHTPLVSPVPGSPAWRAGVPDGSLVQRVNGAEIWDFSQLLSEVAFGGSSPVEVEVLAPGESTPRVFTITPEKDQELGMYRVGLSPAPDPDAVIGLDPDGPAQAAGLDPTDRLLGVLDQPAELRLTDQLRLAFDSGEPVTLRVEHDGAPREVTVTPTLLQREGPMIFGVGPAETFVHSVREDSPAAAMGFSAGDRLRAIDGTSVWRIGDVTRAVFAAGEVAEIVLERGRQRVVLEAALGSPEERARLLRDVAFELDVDESTVVVTPGSGAALAGIQDGDHVRAIDGVAIKAWEEVQDAARTASKAQRELEFTIDRPGAGADGTEKRIVLSAHAVPLSLPFYGVGLRQASHVYRTHGLVASVKEGTRASWRLMRETGLALKKMLQREVSTKNLGGPIAISQLSYSVSGMGWTKLLFFLCLLSVNLAFLNVLPIPVLDGGHLFFLLVEGIKGSPVSERTLGYSQVIGLVLILSLMVYVTYNDIMRWVGN